MCIYQWSEKTQSWGFPINHFNLSENPFTYGTNILPSFCLWIQGRYVLFAMNVFTNTCNHIGFYWTPMLHKQLAFKSWRSVWTLEVAMWSFCMLVIRRCRLTSCVQCHTGWHFAQKEYTSRCTAVTCYMLNQYRSIGPAGEWCKEEMWPTCMVLYVCVVRLNMVIVNISFVHCLLLGAQGNWHYLATFTTIPWVLGSLAKTQWATNVELTSKWCQQLTSTDHQP